MFIRQECAVTHCHEKPLGSFGNHWFCRDHYCECAIEFSNRALHFKRGIVFETPSLTIREFGAAVRAWEPGARREVAELIAYGVKS